MPDTPPEPSPGTPSAPARTAYERYLPWKHTAEVAFWVLLTLLNGIANSLTMLIDLRRSDLDFADWEPAVWEWSSGLVWLALVPAIVWFTRRFPVHWDNLGQRLALHLAASVVVSLAHVAGMVALRMLVYATQSMEYGFGPWPTELLYEWLKDVRSYALMVSMIEIYRFVLRRLQGEASLLDRPDVGEPVEPVERPDRFLVRKLGREFLVAAADIEWLQAAGNYVDLHLHGRVYPLRSTIGGIGAKLDPARFARVHRSYIVNLDRIASIEPLDTGDARIHLHDGTVVPCSRRYRSALKTSAGAVTS